MAKEPAWRAALRGPIADLFRLKDGVLPAWMSARNSAETIADIVLTLLEPHIKSAVSRSYSAGVSKSGDTIRDLRKQLDTVQAYARERVTGPDADNVASASWVLHLLGEDE